MANRKKKLSREEFLEKKRIAERERKKRIKSDPEKAENLRRKERERYHRKKAEGKILPLSSLPPRKRQRIQKRNRENFSAYYERQKEKRRNADITTRASTTHLSVSPTLRADSSPTQIARLSRPRSVSPDNDTSMSHRLRARHTSNRNESSPIPGTSRPPETSPTVSSIPSPTPSVDMRCPQSPVSNSSINSETFQKEFKKKFRNYQNRKAKQQYTLRERLLAVTREKESYRKRLERMQNMLNVKKTNSPARKLAPPTTQKAISINRQLRSTVIKFYEDDENSRLGPGKKECLTRNGLKKQKRYLTDSVKNLHLKYLRSGYPPISYVTFGRLKPFWVVKPNLNTRDSCLCQTHANMELLVSAMKMKKIVTESTTSDVLKSLCCDANSVDCLLRKCLKCKNKVINYKEFSNTENMTYWTWEKNRKTYVKENIEKIANVVAKVKCHAKPLAVIQKFEKSLVPFLKHCGYIKNQYNAIKTIKQNIAENECLIHIDFSENYGTKYNAEVQAVHFGGSRSQITLHTSVIYYPLRDRNLGSQSYCTVSECLRHDASAVWAHLIPVLQELETLLPSVETIHIVSDSPSAQYRNKKIFYIISQLRSYCPNLSLVTWNYCECGHGKGAPDGIGGVLKRTADQLVAYGQDIPDLNTFVQKLKSSVTGVKLQVVEDYEVTEKDWLLPANLKTFTGTMKVHQAIWKKGVNKVALRSLSCTELECLNSPIQCSHEKHLGYYHLAEESGNISQALQPTVPRSQPSKVHRFKSSEGFVLKPSKRQNDNQTSTLNISLDIPLPEDLNMDSDNMNPSTFFNNIGDSTFSKYENSTDLNVTQRTPDTTIYQKTHDEDESDSDSDYNIF